MSSEHLHEGLCKLPNEAKILQAIQGMAAWKSPGPDVRVGFFQKFWHIIKNEGVHLIQNIFLGTKNIQGFNATHIYLLPKKSRLNILRIFNQSVFVMSHILLQLIDWYSSSSYW